MPPLTVGELTVDRIVELEHWPFATRDLFPTAAGCDRLDLQIRRHGRYGGPPRRRPGHRATDVCLG